jgi:hypothetical protein
MSSHTERTHRLLLLWLDLQRATGKSGRPRVVPWECADEEVVQLWEQITHPQNERHLEEWLCQMAAGELELWAQQALLTCRRRCGRNR